MPWQPWSPKHRSLGFGAHEDDAGKQNVGIRRQLVTTVQACAARLRRMADPVLRALATLTRFTVRRGETWRDGRALRWVEAGSGDLTVICDASLGEPGSLAWAGLLPVVPAFARVVAYDRAGIGASDPVASLTLSSHVDDLITVISATGNPPSILVGHSLGWLCQLDLAPPLYFDLAPPRSGLPRIVAL